MLMIQYVNIVNILRLVTKTEDGRYVIINSDGRSIPLKVASGQKETETRKYIVKCKFAFSYSNRIGS